MPNPDRMNKINELLSQELSLLIEEDGERLGMLAVVSIDTSRDLSRADVFMAGISGPITKEVQKILTSEAGRYRHDLGRKLNFRRIPEFVFHFEQDPDTYQRLEATLAAIDREQAA